MIRHGEVENPTGVVYGRLPGFHLSERGRRQAAAAASALKDAGADVRRIVSSPLERTMESAAPIGEMFGLEIETDQDLLEATSRLEGKSYDVSLAILGHPSAWRYLVNPFRPSWGEPYRPVLERMSRAIRRAATETDGGDLVVVAHQMPIWAVSRNAQGKPLFHDPRKRQCAHSSITTLEFRGDTLVPAGYLDPGREV